MSISFPLEQSPLRLNACGHCALSMIELRTQLSLLTESWRECSTMRLNCSSACLSQVGMVLREIIASSFMPKLAACARSSRRSASDSGSSLSSNAGGVAIVLAIKEAVVA